MILEMKIEDLQLYNKSLKILKNNNINKVKDLWQMKRVQLKALGLNDKEIRQIIIKLQLCGIDLNKRIY